MNFSALKNGYHSVWYDIECRTTTKKDTILTALSCMARLFNKTKKRPQLGRAIRGCTSSCLTYMPTTFTEKLIVSCSSLSKTLNREVEGNDRLDTEVCTIQPSRQLYGKMWWEGVTITFFIDPSLSFSCSWPCRYSKPELRTGVDMQIGQSKSQKDTPLSPKCGFHT